MRITRSLTAAVLTGLLAMGSVAASGDEGGARSSQSTVADLPRIVDLPLETLEDILPLDAADAGLDFAPQLVKVFSHGEVDRNAIASSGLDVTEHAGHGYVEVVVNDQQQQDLLDSLGVLYEVVTPDLITQERERILADAAFAQATTVTSLPSGRDSYRVLADFEAEIDQLVADNPDIAKKIVVGQSVEGRNLNGIEIGVGVNEPEDGRPVMLMFGNHHAREWPSATAPMEFAHDLLATFNAGDARTVDLLSRARAIIVPVSNPDGYDASRTAGDLIDLNTVDGGGTVSILATPGNAYKRKNCRIIGGQTQPAGACVAFSSPGGYGIGIDLNRNYGALWGGPGADGFPNTASALYRGPAPFSEPETAAIRELISSRQVTTLISNHTFSNLLLRPVGIQPFTIGPDDFPIGFAPDECFTTADGTDMGMQALGERMTAQVGYTNQFGWELYDTTGTTEDYSYNATGGYGYTFEIGPDQFHPPFEEVIAEYVGTSAAAEAVTPESAPALTTSTARDCEGDDHDHETVGGGLREAYFIALENAADSATHSVITGSAPEGAEVAVTRTGTFPLWDKTEVEDTVTTTMTVADDAEVTAAATGDSVPFSYHVNPSTRPFVASRAYVPCDEEDRSLCENPTPEATEVSSETFAGDVSSAPPAQTQDFPLVVGDGLDAITLTMSAASPSDDWDLALLSPDLVPLGSSESGGSDEFIQYIRQSGLEPGEYVVRVTNFSAVGTFEVLASLGTVPAVPEPIEYAFTPASTELWTLTCTLDGEQIDTMEVEVDRGESVDVGDLCVVAASNTPTAAPEVDDTDDLAATGGGAAALAALAMGGAVALSGRRRKD